MYTPIRSSALLIRRPRFFLLTVTALVIGCAQASAQWVTESYPLKAGFNAIWLSIDCSDRSIGELLPPGTDVDVASVGCPPYAIVFPSVIAPPTNSLFSGWLVN